jgi:hypothetical protein
LGATGGPASLLGWYVRTRASFLFVSAETVNQITEQGAGGIAIGFRRSNGLKLHQSVPGAYTALEFRFERIEFFPFLVPHELHVSNWAGVIEQQKKVFKQLQILLELPPQGSAKDGLLLFHG